MSKEDRRELQIKPHRIGLDFASKDQAVEVLGILGELSDEHPIDYDYPGVKDGRIIVLPKRVFKLLSPRLKNQGIEYSEIPVVSISSLSSGEQVRLKGRTIKR